MRMGLPLDGVVAALATFRGVKRRQEVIAEGRGITVIDDFAHHPTAVAGDARGAPRRAIRSGGSGRSSSRAPTRPAGASFRTRSRDAFAGADRVTFGAVHRREQLPEAERLSVDELIAALGRARRRGGDLRGSRRDRGAGRASGRRRATSSC